MVGGAAAAVVAAGSTVGLVEAEVLPGRRRLHAALGLDGPDGKIPDIEPGAAWSGTFSVDGGAAEAGWSVVVPPGHYIGGGLPVVIALHGKGGDHRSAFDDLGLDRFLAQAVAAGAAPAGVASIDGGDSYWHRRADGTDRGAAVLDQLLPELAGLGFDTERLAFIGWSMGGYGSLLLGGQIGLPRVRAVSTMSAALWVAGADAAPGAFDDAADRSAHDVFTSQERLVDMPLRMDCGQDDPFRAANDAYRDAFDGQVAGGTQPGGHTEGYWRRMAPRQLEFVLGHLS